MGQYTLLDDAAPAQPAQTGGYELLPDAPPPLTRLKKYIQGAMDPIAGGAQMLMHALPALASKVEGLHWASGPDGQQSSLGKGGFDKDIADRETQYQAARSGNGETGIDGYRLLGNVVNPVNVGLGMAGGALAPASLAGRVAVGAGLGAGSAALSPVTSGDFATEKQGQMTSGGIVGAVLPGVGAAAGRIISPQIRQSVKTLLADKVTPTMGQILGGGYQRLEDKLMSVPLIGDAISSARGKGLDEFNRAAMARALKPIGGDVPADTGRDAVASVRNQLSDKYNALLPRLTFKADPQFSQEMGNLSQMAQSLTPTEATQYQTLMAKHLSQMSPNGTMTGEAFKKLESGLGQDAKKFSSSLDPYQRDLGSALSETLQTFRTGLARSIADPADAQALKSINTGYANYARIKQAAGGVGALDGKFTPAQLGAAVRKGDQSSGHRAFSEGTALMQDLTDAGKDALSQKYPDSGTAGRAMIGRMTAGGGMAGLAAINPGTAALTALTAAPYLPGGRQAMAALLAKRPELAKPIAEAVKNGSLVLAPGVAPALNNANGN